MPPSNCAIATSYAPWSTGDDVNKDLYNQQRLLSQVELNGGEFWSSGSSDLETPAWDIEYSDNGPGAWDYELSTQLAAKLLMVDPTAGSCQLPDPDSDGSVGGGSAAFTNPRFKTEFCRNYKEKGTCLYGDLCQFAHGRHELRKDVVRHNKYKTKLCQKFWIVGYCAYGPRCNFVHNELDITPQGTSNQAYRDGSGAGGTNLNGGGNRFREYHVSYRKTSLGDSGVDSGSEHGSVVAAAAVVGQLSPTHIFHPEDNPLPLGRTCNNSSSCNHKSPPTTSQAVIGSGPLLSRRAWDLPYF